jgi:hypothetical protein
MCTHTYIHTYMHAPCSRLRALSQPECRDSGELSFVRIELSLVGLIRLTNFIRFQEDAANEKRARAHTHTHTHAHTHAYTHTQHAHTHTHIAYMNNALKREQRMKSITEGILHIFFFVDVLINSFHKSGTEIK